ncbi:hypothetical protein B0H11DRAFT_2271922 [Mycena galericulata]|nr:hypothetical protein B0H11DRAFT_2271922 [Mycena galericulata]
MSCDQPRTPSPPTMRNYSASPIQNYKTELDPVRIFSQDDQQDYQWQQQQTSSSHFSRPSLLQELYDGDGLSPEHPSPPDMYVDNDWPAAPQQPQRPVDYTLIRRATFPYARQERPEDLAAYPPFLHHDVSPYHPHHMPLSAEPSALHGGDHTYSPPGYGPEYDSGSGDPAVKLEEGHHHLNGHGHGHPGYHHSAAQFYGARGHPGHLPPHLQQHPHHGHGYPHPHAHLAHPAHHMGGGGGGMGYPPVGLAVQHTDDAASKETQYLRRRCFNCHTTEPPSWRRSTLNPGKIVCNKCGLYERTHLRARPLRFDELRAGNKARKGAKGVQGGSPKGGVAKKVGGGGAGARRSSVSSTGSSAQSGSGQSDWDDSVSVYSNGSAPPTSFNSPAFSPHPPALTLSSSNSTSSSNNGERDSLSRSPPLLGSPPHSGNSLMNGGSHSINGGGGGGGNGIRLPHAPDIPTLSHPSHHGGGHGMRTKPRSNTTGGSFYSAHGHGHHQLHHSSSNSSLHSNGGFQGGSPGMHGGSPGMHAQQHGGSPAMLHASPPLMHSSHPSHPSHESVAGGELYRRGSMPDMHGGWDDVMAAGGVGAMMVKEEPRALVV